MDRDHLLKEVLLLTNVHHIVITVCNNSHRFVSSIVSNLVDCIVIIITYY
jgi:hypothetical protein